MLRPIGNRVVIKIKRENETESGILLPNGDREAKQEGIVEESNVESINKGDQVLFSPYGPQEFKIGEEYYVIAEESHLIGKYE